MAWYVIAHTDPALLETLYDLRVPADRVHITAPRAIDNAITFPDTNAREAAIALGEDPNAVTFRGQPTNLPGYVFVTLEGPATADSDVPEFYWTLRQAARAFGVPLRYQLIVGKKPVLPDFPAGGVLISEDRQSQSVVEKTTLFGNRCHWSGHAPAGTGLVLQDDDGTPYAEIEPRHIRLLLNLREHRACPEITAVLERLLPEALALALDPGLPQIIAEELRLTREAEQARKLEQELRQEQERRERLERIGKTKRDRWIAICRTQRRTDTEELLADLARQEGRFDELLGKLIAAGWEREALAVRQEAIAAGIEQAAAKARTALDAIRTNPAVAEVFAKNEGDGIVIQTIPLPPDTAGTSWCIALGSGPPLIWKRNEPPPHGIHEQTHPLDPDVLRVLITLTLDGEYAAAAELALRALWNDDLPERTDPTTDHTNGALEALAAAGLKKSAASLAAALQKQNAALEAVELELKTASNQLAGLRERETEIEEGENFGAEFDTLIANPKIADLDITDTELTVVTSELCIPYRDKKYWIDPLKVVVQFKEGGYNPHRGPGDFPKISVYKSHPKQKVSTGHGYAGEGGNWPAPHVRGNGSVCLGNMQDLVAATWKKKQWASLIEVLLPFLESIAGPSYAGILSDVAIRVE